MKIQNALVSNILDRSQRYFAHVTTVTLLWRVKNIVVIGRVYVTLECFEFSSNFEFDRNMLSGTGAWPMLQDPFDDKSTLIRVTVSCLQKKHCFQTTSHYLNQCWLSTVMRLAYYNQMKWILWCVILDILICRKYIQTPDFQVVFCHTSCDFLNKETLLFNTLHQIANILQITFRDAFSW